MLVDRRAKYRADLHDAYKPYYDALCGILSDYWQPISSFRSFATQDGLYAQGRTQPGSIVTRVPGGLSFHNYGLATDWGYFNNPGEWSDLRSDAPLWNEYTSACEKVGLRCLAWEKPHNEIPLKTPLAEIFEAYKKGGPSAITPLIKAGLPA